VLKHLWAASAPTDGIESLAEVMTWWADQLEERAVRLKVGYDPGLLAHGARLLRELPQTANRSVLLHGDANPGNLLAATRTPWLAIDPKPMIGDPAYDPVPLIDQLDDLYHQPHANSLLTERAALAAAHLDLDPQRILAWTLARQVEYALACIDDHDPSAAVDAITDAQTVANVLGI
jgi:streptomycin 6-kinase